MKKLFLIVNILIVMLLLTGCSELPDEQGGNGSAISNAEAPVSQYESDLLKLTDGILYCISTSNYKWLKYYADTDLSGLQVARLLLGDAAFDRKILSWNLSLAEIQMQQEGTLAQVSIPVTHEARFDKKYSSRTTIFNFQYYYSEQHDRWLLNFNFLVQ